MDGIFSVRFYFFLVLTVTVRHLTDAYCGTSDVCKVKTKMTASDSIV